MYIRKLAFIKNVENIDPKVKHYAGMPSELSGGIPAQVRLSFPDVLVLLETKEGFFLHRYTKADEFGGDTWHKTENDAYAQAEFEFDGLMQKWEDISQEVADPIEYAISQVSRR